MVEIRFTLRDCSDVEILARPQRCHKGAREDAVVLDQHSGWQVLCISVDGVAEQHQLHEWDEDHSGEGDAVATKLDQLLHEDCVDAGKSGERGYRYSSAERWPAR